PLHRFTQTFLKTHGGPEPQRIARRRDVGKGMLYVRLAWFGIYRTLAIARRPLKDGVNLVQRSLTAGCQVENTAVYLIGGCLNGQQICLNDVLYVCEIPRLLTVAKDCGLLTIEHLLDETREHSGVR